MLVVFKSLVDYPSRLGQTMFLPLAGFNRHESACGSENKDQSRRQCPPPEDDSKEGQACSDKQKSNREMNNRRMQGLRDWYHAASFTAQAPHRKANSREESDNTPFLNTGRRYLLRNQNS